jgi:hypothetical protein
VQAIAETDERLLLLQRITGPLTVPNDVAPTPAENGHSAHGGRVLRGPAIRSTAVKVVLDHPERP